MVYDFLGKKMTRKEVHNELLYNPTIKNRDLKGIYVYLGAQEKINAERRMENETDPYRKRMMEEMYSHGMYNFDKYFGEE